MRNCGEKTGTDLKGLACGAAGLDEETFDRLAIAATVCRCADNRRGRHHPRVFGGGPAHPDSHRLGGLRLCAGRRGRIGRSISAQMRADLFSGRNSFVAIHTRAITVVSNTAATGAGYAWGLRQMAGGVSGKTVLVIGCGPVGRSAAQRLRWPWGPVSIHDVDRAKAASWQHSELLTSIRAEEDFRRPWRATRSSSMRRRQLGSSTPMRRPRNFISAPGVPIGFTAEAVAKASDRVLHDFLEIGVATMAALALGRER